MARSPRLGGWVAGLALAAWLAISLEGLPMAAAIAGIAALRWLRDRDQRALLVHLMLALATGSALLFAATRGLSDLAQHCDAVSPVHLAVFAWGAAVIAVLGQTRPSPMLALAGFAVAAVGGLAWLVTLAPQCGGGAFVELDPVVRRFWYDGVAEGLPIWRQPLGFALQTIVPVLVALLASARIAATRSDAWLARWWTDYTLLLGAALGIALFVSRAGAVAGALAAVPLGWLMREWIAALRTTRPGAKVLLGSALVMALQPSAPVTAYAAIARSSAAAAPPPAEGCRIDVIAPALRALPRGDILAPLDIGPMILLDTRHTVVATGHHRAGPAMRAVIDAFTGSSDQAHAIVTARGVDYVALCSGLAEPQVYRDAAPGGLAADLGENRAPAWLQPIPLPNGSQLKIWRVVR